MFKNILVTLDGSPVSEQSLPYATRLAQSCQARVTLIRVVQASYPYEAGMGAMLTPAPAPIITGFDESIRIDEQTARQYLEDIQQRLIAQGIPSVTIAEEVGAPAEIIEEYSKHNNIDLILMTSHCRSGLGRLLQGSISEHVLRHTHIPLLVIPIHGKEATAEVAAWDEATVTPTTESAMAPTPDVPAATATNPHPLIPETAINHTTDPTQADLPIL